MVIEHSFMNKSYTAKINIYIYICILQGQGLEKSGAASILLREKKYCAQKFLCANDSPEKLLGI